MEVAGSSLQALPQAMDSSSMRTGEQRVSDKVMTAVGKSFSFGTATFKLGKTIFFAESEGLIFLPLNIPHKKNNIFQPAQTDRIQAINL
jgi:hypothetical protein